MNKKQLTPEQIRGSFVIVVIKLVIILLIFEAAYEFLFYLLNIQFALPIDWHHHISIGLFVLSLLKIFIEVYFITSLFLSWIGNVWLFTDKHIVKRTGVFHTQENVYHFDNIRSISVKQSFIGKLLNYGDIITEISASGGYHSSVVLYHIDNPREYEAIFKKLF